MRTKFFQQKQYYKAFTLVELLVSISIMVIVLGVTMSGGPQAIMRLTLSDNAYQTELLVREAQLQGSAINSLTNVYGGAGVFLDLATNTKVLKFKDRIDTSIVRPVGVGDGLYENAPIDEKDTLYPLVNGNHIGQLCVGTSTGPLLCNAFNTPVINTLTVSFTRPKQNADIYVNNITTKKYERACVQIDSLRTPTPGYVRSIFIYQSGMIVKKIGTCL